MAVGLQARDHVLSGFDRADLVVSRRLRPRSSTRRRRGTRSGTKRIIHIDTQPAEVDAAYRPEVELDRRHRRDAAAAAGRGPAARASAAATPASATRPREILVHADLRTALLAELGAHEADDGWPIKPQRAIADLRRALGPTDIVVSATSAPTRSGSRGCTRRTSRTP